MKTYNKTLLISLFVLCVCPILRPADENQYKALSADQQIFHNKVSAYTEYYLEQRDQKIEQSRKQAIEQIKTEVTVETNHHIDKQIEQTERSMQKIDSLLEKTNSSIQEADAILNNVNPAKPKGFFNSAKDFFSLKNFFGCETQKKENPHSPEPGKLQQIRIAETTLRKAREKRGATKGGITRIAERALRNARENRKKKQYIFDEADFESILEQANAEVLNELRNPDKALPKKTKPSHNGFLGKIINRWKNTPVYSPEYLDSYEKNRKQQELAQKKFQESMAKLLDKPLDS